jgi:heat shock protein HslJ
MMNTRLVTCGVAALLALAACANANKASPPSSSSDLAGRMFVSSNVTVDGDPRPLVAGTQLSLSFANDGISGSAGCNTMSGLVKQQGDVLIVDGALAMTEMGCAADRMQQDQWFADLLTSKPTIILNGDQLTLTAKGTVVGMTDEKATNPERPLTGTDWTLDSIIDGDTVSSIPQGVTSTLELSNDGRIRVMTGCNNGSGTYRAVRDHIKFGPIGMTVLPCTGPAGDAELSVLQVIDGEAAYSIDGTLLTLTKGAHGLTYGAV